MMLNELLAYSSARLPYLGPIAPPPGVLCTVIAGLQCFVIAGSYGQEVSSPTEYSKFASGKKLVDPISTQNGMFRIYVPSTVAAAAITAYQYYCFTSHDEPCFSLAAPLLFVHFFKRCLEVAFVHHYSGTMPKDNANGIGIFYTLITALVALTATPLADIQSERLLQIGLVLFAIGELGNGYHHYLLRMLRQTKRSNDRNYVPPAGGLFSVVATPHYFFELTAWYGLACVSQQLHAFLAAAGMTSYLAGRAVRTNQMYRETFSKEEWPRSKKALVPGIF